VGEREDEKIGGGGEKLVRGDEVRPKGGFLVMFFLFFSFVGFYGMRVLRYVYAVMSYYIMSYRTIQCQMK